MQRGGPAGFTETVSCVLTEGQVHQEAVQEETGRCIWALATIRKAKALRNRIHNGGIRKQRSSGEREAHREDSAGPRTAPQTTIGRENLRKNIRKAERYRAPRQSEGKAISAASGKGRGGVGQVGAVAE
ncbi:hypothetical protein cyc_07612 [Cyclospora cayetanensis]|uniref:Uncharacterized protein n=1 Tax=Cyclospora cayetanensis TaxID=88456 RepID=A0A1D3D9S4_9EIME|nr:hypothetical protein cyc_07612 [Cyclospora cayetanensis]